MVKLRKNNKPKRKLIACLLSAVIPGTGHIYLGLIQKGLAFILTIILVIEALLYFSATGIKINVPLLILLGLMVPVIYFYSVYDVLQATDRVNVRRRTRVNELYDWRRSMTFALILLGEGVLLLVLHSRPLWFRQLMESYGREMAAASLVILGLGFAVAQIFSIRRAATPQPHSHPAEPPQPAGKEGTHDS
ncbi:hypothetical protein B9G55_23170 [Saccharibacillus sp. O16]|nr:hypothetical protein B9G55_23170 [Saccharibacillus sp. O16]